EILSVNGAKISDVRELKSHIETRAGESVLLQYRRAGAERTTRVEVEAAEPAGESATGTRQGVIRVQLPGGGAYPEHMLKHTSLGLFAALGHASAEAWNMTALQAKIFGRMLTGQVSLKNLSGPLAIAEFAGDSAVAGVASFVSFLVLISLSLGFLNLLPIPILDGGQIVYQLLEWAKGGPLSERVQALGQQVGIVLLVLLMGVALFNDIARQFG
ncbi:MAG: site-2 protease family protein, partial [Steroidobacteraceae bacterium]